MYDTKFVFNDVELECDAMDADFQELVEKCDDVLSDEIDAIDEAEDMSKAIRGQAQSYKKFFDSVFGDGTGLKLIGEKDNVRIASDAYLSFAEFLGDQRSTYNENVGQKMDDLGVAENKPNRAERRSKKKK